MKTLIAKKWQNIWLALESLISIEGSAETLASQNLLELRRDFLGVSLRYVLGDRGPDLTKMMSLNFFGHGSKIV